MSILTQSIRSVLALSVVAAATQSASALDISLYDASTVNVYLSGSTAVDNSLVNVAIATVAPGGLCQANTIDEYIIPSTNRMIFCSASSTSGITSGTKLAIFKESNVGSANGVTPLYLTAEGQPNTLLFLQPTAANLSAANCPAAAPVAATATTSAYTPHNCVATVNTVNANPTAGFADVEAAILRDPNNGALDAAATKKYLTPTGTIDQIWTVLLTKNAFYALQAAEGYGAASDNPANAPSLSREEVASLLSGDIVNWSQLGVTATDDNVYLCRRDAGSGTEASFESQFLNERCSSIAGDTIPAEDGQFVFASGSAGNVRTCLHAFDLGGNVTPYYVPGTYLIAGVNGNPANPPVAEPGGQFAIGINNAEITNGNLTSAFPTGAADSFRVVAVDGAGPTVPNVQNGVYPYFSTGVSYVISSGTGVPTGNPKAVVTTLLSKLGHPTFTANSNATYTGNVPWSPTQATGDASPAPIYGSTNKLSAVPSTTALAAVNPTNLFTKAFSGSVNNCDTPVFNTVQGHTTPESKLLGDTHINN